MEFDDRIHVILDRDGVINIDRGYTHKVEDFAFPPGTPEGLQLLGAVKKLVISIASNQSGIARGMYTESDMVTFNQHMVREIGALGVISVMRFVFCPHSKSANCNCRKPKPGLLHQINDSIGPIDWEKAWVVGDKVSDIQAGLAVGARGILIRSCAANNTTGEYYWTEEDPKVQQLIETGRVSIASDLREAADVILAGIKD